ncbi:MAG: hypothetical protein A3H59_02220 [Candidatus Jacksonbacteria bacterium RIFCSPLOWO2_02_FULL_43_9]|nr:MAG: Response regulator [Parcubacteria group bacterium GW2011_GWA2_43_13]OGY69279.1 MAG: hypothetical protein A3B94_02080 [Candidatus Jacksonbacteria bacterium RIFCSPHIGHO2_02_FULL_43_10]OGY71623.1 MAG: hypothetical protein A2986_01810 [Candidatus Jacksonbacteria bacterium RIFCSPLOWO2_01_FULL_44_13]OGY74420.1 MAG: hypothetical protein A3H59_02220 [Candidatus Jacksonbacteria bacterium RIFCSPLOWO2_02_FULL_43_9]HAZ16623.1 response regulator [Candidatus Jacksonbacteria bacterium]
MNLIFIVEDDQFLSQLYVKKFEQEGFRVVCAKTAEEAEQEMNREMPNCVLLDIGLPDRSGLDFLESLRLKGGYEKVLFIVLTNNDSARDVKRALRLGGAKYLLKSHYTPSEVVEEVKALLRK